MGKIPAILVALLVLWVAWNLYQNGPEKSVGGLFQLIGQPQYGEADRATRSGDLADRILEKDVPQEED